MAKVIVQNPFSSVKEVAFTHKIQLPRPHEWRLMSQCFTGEIQGIATIRGLAVATNGIHVAILTGESLEIAHLDWFVPDQQDPAANHATTKVGKMPTENIFESFML